jgi:hypothetical protein
MGLSLVRKTRCPLLLLQSNRTRTNAWVVLVTTIVTILRFTITPTTAVVCFRWVLFCGHIVHTPFHSFANSACYCIRGGTHPWVNPST